MHNDGSAGANRWHEHAWRARVVRFIAYAAPFLVSILGALVLSHVLPLAHGWVLGIARLIAIAAASTVLLYGADRITRRLLPLAALLSLTLVFPDEAPSRFKIALRAGGKSEIERRLEEYKRTGADEPAVAAERLLELVGDLSRHDRLTRGHSERVRAYSQMIGEELGMTTAEIDALRWAALLHDIGKLHVPYEILNKPGALTVEEFDIVKRHPAIGAELTMPLAGWLGPAILAVGQHHERWDGDGYPNRLRGTGIAMSARIVAVADTFDVMTSVRSYKKATTAAEARAELARCAGSQFDETVVRAFLSISLGKLRLAMGPASWLTQLALFPTGLAGATGPAMMAVAGLAAATFGVAVTPDVGVPTRPVAAVATDQRPLPAEVERTGGSILVGSDGSSPSGPQSGVSSTAPGDSSDGSVGDSAGDAVTVAGETVQVGAPPADDSVVGQISQTDADAGANPAPVTVGAIEGAPVSGTAVDRATETSAAEPSQAGATTSPPSGTPADPPETVPPASPSITLGSGPTTTAAASTPPTTAPPPTAASPTTSAPPTTSPPASPPPTSPPPTGAQTYLLGSSAIGDVVSQPVLDLVIRGALNPGQLPNLDADRDNKPGLTLKKDALLSPEDSDKIQRFRLDPTGEMHLSGPASLVLFAAPQNLSSDSIEVEAALIDCPDAGQCAPFATVTIMFSGTDDQFTALTFDFGPQDHVIAPSHRLELWIIDTAASHHHMWIAYDTVGYESALTLNS